MRHRGWAVAMVAMMAVGLVACSGGGDDEEEDDQGPPAPTIAAIAGIWTGSITATGSGVTSTATLLADESGDTLIRLTVPGTAGFTLRGDACCETSGSGTAAAFQGGIAGSTSVNVTLNMSGDMMTGSFTLNGTAYTMSLARSPIYLQSTSLAAIAGTYTRQLTSGFTITLTVHADGQFDGSDSSGCIYNGQLALPRPDRTLFRIASMTLSSCAGALAVQNGSYSGLATLSPETTGGPLNAFVYFVTGPTTLVPLSPTRN